MSQSGIVEIPRHHLKRQSVMPAEAGNPGFIALLAPPIFNLTVVRTIPYFTGIAASADFKIE